MHEDLADLIPLFLGEARERLARLHELLPQVGISPEALHGARRELHTLEGSSRMLGLGGLATLCRDGQGMLADEVALPIAAVADVLDHVGIALDELASAAGSSPCA